jgi:hypothetical protein
MPHLALELTNPLSNTGFVIVKSCRPGKLAKMDFSKPTNPLYPQGVEKECGT